MLKNLPNHILIECIAQNEINLIISLLKELYLELGEEAESIYFLNRELITKILSSGMTEIYLVKMDRQKIAGIFVLTECQSIYAGGKYGLIDEMYIKPEFRSIKIGSYLIEKANIIGREKNWKRIDVTSPTEDKGKKVRAFYEKCGFVFTGSKLKLKL